MTDFDPLSVPCIICGAAKNEQCKSFIAGAIHGFRIDQAKREHVKPGAAK